VFVESDNLSAWHDHLIEMIDDEQQTRESVENGSSTTELDFGQFLLLVHFYTAVKQHVYQ